MLKSIHKLFFVLFLCWTCPGMLSAQQARAGSASDTVAEESSFSWRPAALRLGLDVSRLTTLVLEPDARFYELNTDLQFGRYFLAVDWGAGRQVREADQFNYRTEGSYFRIGADINFIPENEDNNLLFIGLRYGRSFYNEQLNAQYDGPVFGPFSVSYDRPLSARWVEGVAGMKARLWKGLFLGYTLRYKFGLKTNNSEAFTSYEVPGFGRVGDGNAFAFNYHISYRIPFY